VRVPVSARVINRYRIIVPKLTLCDYRQGLISAAKRGQLEIVKILVDIPNIKDIDHLALIEACMLGDIQIVSLIFSITTIEISPNFRRAFLTGIRQGHVDVVKYFLEKVVGIVDLSRSTLKIPTEEEWYETPLGACVEIIKFKRKSPAVLVEMLRVLIEDRRVLYVETSSNCFIYSLAAVPGSIEAIELIINREDLLQMLNVDMKKLFEGSCAETAAVLWKKYKHLLPPIINISNLCTPAAYDLIKDKKSLCIICE